MRTWHIITPEYPPSLGGVSDYSALVATGLRQAGDEVSVWCPGRSDAASAPWVHRIARGFGVRGLRELNRGLNASHESKLLLIQWVPHGYGWRAMNLFFCLWVLYRSLKGDRIQLMLHEAFLAFGGNWRQRIAALIQRVMTIILFLATRHVWVSSPSWRPMLLPFTLGRNLSFTWLAIPSNIPVSASDDVVAELRETYAPNAAPLVGHFGTHNHLTTDMLDTIIPSLLARNGNAKMLLIGANSERYRERMIVMQPSLADRLIATGALDSASISRHLLICDVMIQPYPEGVTARRTTCIAGLAHGKAVVSCDGSMTEDFWKQDVPPMVLSSSCDEIVDAVSDLLANPQQRQQLGHRATEYYRATLAPEHMIRTLRLGFASEGTC
jgi:glycosyltransferase involved in cell wall biosynthesis